MVNMTEITTLAVGVLLVNPILSHLNAWRKEWFAYKRTGEYNFDGDKETPDWANQRDPATGKWGLIKIVGYVAPIIPGSGRIIFHTTDECGNERTHSWRLCQWENNRENRCAASAQQQQAIHEMNGDWPSRIAEPECRAHRIDDRLDAIEASNREISLVVLRDLKQVFVETKDLLELGNRVSAWEKSRPVALGKLNKRVTALENKVCRKK